MVSQSLLVRAGFTATLVATLALAGSASPQSKDKSTSQSRLTFSPDAAEASKKTLLVFPFDAPTTVPGQADVSILLTDVARSRLIASGTYTVVQFYKSLAPVARLHNDQALSDADIAPPFAEDNAKAIKVTKAVGYDFAFVGSVDDYTFNEADKQATITISGRLLDVATGKILKSATLSGSSSKGGNAKEPDKAMEAARAAGEQMMTKVVPQIIVANVAPPPVPAKNPPPPKHNGKKRNGNGVLLGLLAVVIGLGIGLSGGGGGGSVADLPPAPPH